MARPQKLQRLRHGRILSAGAFPGFVATWNWLCGIVESWVGDQDIGGDGCIHVDRTNADVPVIRLDEVKLGRRLKVSNIPELGCWRIVAGSVSAEYEDPETGETETATSMVHTIDRQFFQVGGALFQGGDNTTVETFLEEGKPFIAARIGYGKSGAENPGYGVQLRGYGSIAEMQADSLVKTYSLIPLYELQPPESAGAEEEDKPIPVIVKTDFRAIPVAQAFEMPLSGV